MLFTFTQYTCVQTMASSLPLPSIHTRSYKYYVFILYLVLNMVRKRAKDRNLVYKMRACVGRWILLEKRRVGRER